MWECTGEAHVWTHPGNQQPFGLDEDTETSLSLAPVSLV